MCCFRQEDITLNLMHPESMSLFQTSGNPALERFLIDTKTRILYIFYASFQTPI